MFHNSRLDSPPPASQFRRPWSPEPFVPQEERNHREPTDESVQALDLVDYAQTLRPFRGFAPAHRPPSHRPLQSMDSIDRPPSLVSRGDTRSSRSYTSSSHPHSLHPAARPYHNAPLSSHNSTDPEIDISQFPSWSHGWYDNNPQRQRAFDPAYDPYDDYDPYDPYAKRPPFEPTHTHSSQYLPSYPSSSGHRDVLPWGPDPPSYPVDPDTKYERMRMLEREFGGSKNNGRPNSQDEYGAELPVIGSVDNKGKLITAGPKKRTALRFAQILLALAASIPAIYAALVIKTPKPPDNPPPQGSKQAYILYGLSVVTLFVLLYFYVIRRCCGPRNKAANQGPLANGMMVLPVANPNGKKNKKPKGKKKGAPQQGDVQVNLIVDPGVFGGGHNRDDSWDDDRTSSIPGSYGGSSGSGGRRRTPRRRSVFAGLAMEEQWRVARSSLRKLTLLDALMLILWGALFVYIMLGKRCPIGGFNGWCTAYNTSVAAACLLAVAFGLGVFFGVKDLAASSQSPRTRA